MKKILFFVILVLSIFSLNSQTFDWDEPIKVFDDNFADMGKGFQFSNGKAVRLYYETDEDNVNLNMFLYDENGDLIQDDPFLIYNGDIEYFSADIIENDDDSFLISWININEDQHTLMFEKIDYTGNMLQNYSYELSDYNIGSYYLLKNDNNYFYIYRCSNSVVYKKFNYDFELVQTGNIVFDEGSYVYLYSAFLTNDFLIIQNNHNFHKVDLVDFSIIDEFVNDVSTSLIYHDDEFVYTVDYDQNLKKISIAEFELVQSIDTYDFDNFSKISLIKYGEYFLLHIDGLLVKLNEDLEYVDSIAYDVDSYREYLVIENELPVLYRFFYPEFQIEKMMFDDNLDLIFTSQMEIDEEIQNFSTYMAFYSFNEKVIFWGYETSGYRIFMTQIEAEHNSDVITGERLIEKFQYTGFDSIFYADEKINVLMGNYFQKIDSEGNLQFPGNGKCLDFESSGYYSLSQQIDDKIYFVNRNYGSVSVTVTDLNANILTQDEFLYDANDATQYIEPQKIIVFENHIYVYYKTFSEVWQTIHKFFEIIDGEILFPQDNLLFMFANSYGEVNNLRIVGNNLFFGDLNQDLYKVSNCFTENNEPELLLENNFYPHRIFEIVDNDKLVVNHYGIQLYDFDGNLLASLTTQGTFFDRVISKNGKMIIEFIDSQQRLKVFDLDGNSIFTLTMSSFFTNENSYVLNMIPYDDNFVIVSREDGIYKIYLVDYEGNIIFEDSVNNSAMNDNIIIEDLEYLPNGQLALLYSKVGAVHDMRQEEERDIYVKLYDFQNMVDNEDDVNPQVTMQLKAYPNPFNPQTTISFNIHEKSKVELDVYNVKGQKVKSLLNEEMNAGKHSIVWNGIDDQNQKVSSGIYFYKMRNGKYTSTKKMILLK